MEDQRDDGRTYPVEDRRDRFQAAKVHVQRTERRYDEEVRQNECPSSGPGTSLAATQVGDEDSHLDRERPREGLADRDRFAHLFPGEPAALGDELALHLADERHRTAEAEQTQAQEVAHEFPDAA